MGKKINPRIFRTQMFGYPSKWFARGRNYRQYLKEDILIREFIKKKLKSGGVAKMEIERSAGTLEIDLYTSKPGVVIGRKGEGIEKLRQALKEKFHPQEKINIILNIQEVKKAELDAEIVLQNIIDQLEKRIPFRRVLKRTIERTMQSGALGVKTRVAGRLDGVEIARTETLKTGKLPTHTLRSNIDYARGAAQTIYGKIGVKVWIYKGEIFDKEKDVITEKSKI